MAKFLVIQTTEVVVEVNDPNVIERFTGPQGDEVRAGSYPLFTRDDVLEHLAYNASANGQNNASGLDGFADLPNDAVVMRIKNVDVEEIKELK